MWHLPSALCTAVSKGWGAGATALTSDALSRDRRSPLVVQLLPLVPAAAGADPAMRQILTVLWHYVFVSLPLPLGLLALRLLAVRGQPLVRDVGRVCQTGACALDSHLGAQQRQVLAPVQVHSQNLRQCRRGLGLDVVLAHVCARAPRRDVLTAVHSADGKCHIVVGSAVCSIDIVRRYGENARAL
jgi:hypothetical protein